MLFRSKMRSGDQQVPQPKHMKQKAIQLCRNPQRVQFVEQFLDADRWKEITASPQKAFQAWLALHKLKAINHWSWTREKDNAGGMQFHGLVRVLEDDILTYPYLLAT